MKAILLLALSAIILSQSYGFAYADHGGLMPHMWLEAGGTETITSLELILHHTQQVK